MQFVSATSARNLRDVNKMADSSHGAGNWFTVEVTDMLLPGSVAQLRWRS